jgi:hypothetical protein
VTNPAVLSIKMRTPNRFKHTPPWTRQAYKETGIVSAP